MRLVVLFCCLIGTVLGSEIEYRVPLGESFVTIRLDSDWRLVKEEITEKGLEVVFKDATGYGYQFQVQEGFVSLEEKQGADIKKFKNYVAGAKLVADRWVKMGDEARAKHFLMTYRSRYANSFNAFLYGMRKGHFVGVQFSPRDFKMKLGEESKEVIERVVTDQFARVEVQ